MSDGDIQEQEIQMIKEKCRNYLEDSFKKAKSGNIQSEIDTMKGLWAGYSSSSEQQEVEIDVLKEQITNIIDPLIRLPFDFNPHPKINKLMETRRSMALGKQI